MLLLYYENTLKLNPLFNYENTPIAKRFNYFHKKCVIAVKTAQLKRFYIEKIYIRKEY